MRDRDAIYQDILQLGRRRAEYAWMYGHAEWARAEKTHIALIPGLLRCDDERRHRHYLEAGRAAFVKKCKHRATDEFEPLWAELCGRFPPAPAPQDIPMATVAGPVVLNYRGRAGGSE